MATSVIPKSVNPDLQKERDGASFSSEEFAAWWAGSEEELKFTRGIRKSIPLAIFGLSVGGNIYRVMLTRLFFSGDYLQKDVNLDEMLQIQNMSHEDINEFSIRTSIDAAKKLRRLQEERNPGGEEYWP